MIAIYALLVAAIVASAWAGLGRWNRSQAARRQILEARLPHATPPPPAAAPRPDPPPAANYVDVATKDLFAKDRNPAVLIEAPKIEKVKEMPPLPIVFGVLGLPSGVKALMAEKAGAGSQAVHVGDSIGEFKIAALDPQNVTFLWEDKEIHKKIEDLLNRNEPPPAGGAGQAAVNQQPGIQAAPPPPPASVTGSAALGVEVGTPGHSERVCKPGDTSPADTVIDGYKKVLLAMPFGVNCRWIPVQ